MQNYKEIFRDKGYFILNKVFDENTIKEIYSEIVKAEDVVKYHDRNGYLRRVEQLYNKGPTLRKVNQKILEKFTEIFGEKFVIFKDKYNAKPPGGEGYFSHYDGIFMWKDKNSKDRKGWYEYTDYFVNALIAIDRCTSENGTIQIAKVHNDSFNDLLKKTRNDGTAYLLPEIENNCQFQEIDLKPGDLVVFSHRCPHRSSKNNSKNARRILYYTYTRLNDGFYYDRYFADKATSKNTDKSLQGEY